MKTITKTLYCLPLLFTLSSSIAEESNDSKEILLEAVSGVQSLNQEVASSGVVPSVCNHCPDKEAHQKIVLDKKELDLGHPYYLRANEPYVVRIVRNQHSPKKVTLKFKNGRTVCAKYIAEENPWARGTMIYGCWVEKTEYTDNEISLDLTDLPELKDGKSEVLELKFKKVNPRQYKYTVEVNHLSDSTQKASVSSYLFGDGFKVNFNRTDNKSAPSGE